MISNDAVPIHLKGQPPHTLRGPRDGCPAGSTRCGMAPQSLAAAVVALAAIMMPASAPQAQSILDCPQPPSQDLVMPPQLVRSDNKVLEGAIHLKERHQRMPPGKPGDTKCLGDIFRYFKGVAKGIEGEGQELDPVPSAQPPATSFPDPIPGPTLRARVGDRVQLTFVNEVDANRFDKNVDIGACMEVTANSQSVYPKLKDKVLDTPPNCLHASSTANIHFHGTHTNPNSTGDNVFLQIRPLPRDRGNLTTTPKDVTALFGEFFKACAEQLADPLSRWPVTWDELKKSHKPSWTDKQEELLKAYQQATGQPLWARNEKAQEEKRWPQYYIGAYPYCFVLPEYTAQDWPPPPGSKSPMMGQAPGTHWYHAHKHGSTAINVMNGMTGAFIIEGKYDDDLNDLYGKYELIDGKKWNTRAQPVMVLNQLGTYPKRLIEQSVRAVTPTPTFSVNGRTTPIVRMQPGEVQLWRIINTSGRSAAYFMPPTAGLQWRQTAQDGVQLADENYQDSLDRPFYLAPGNRADLLVKAPLTVTELTAEIRIQDVMARAKLEPPPANPTAANPPGYVLMRVKVSGPPVMREGKAAEMPLPKNVADQPPFLKDITDEEWAKSNYRAQTLTFNSDKRNSAVQHTINGVQFENGKAHVDLQLGAVEEWTIKNSTADPNPGPIDHPFHIHINPFQITEVFDPNELLTDPKTGQLVRDPASNEGIPRYITAESERKHKRQCFLDPANDKTWKPCEPTVPATKRVWWDVFAIPSGRKDSNTGTKVIPGYFKMRSRFVDYPGQYVLHCHILIHEDRGMMFTVSVSAPKPVHEH